MNIRPESQWVASREYTLGPTGPVIVASVGLPRLNSDADWECTISVVGGGADFEAAAFGVDSMQAMLLAVSMLRAHLRTIPNAASLHWLDEADLGLDLV